MEEKVLLIWNSVPEKTEGYILTGEVADIALQCAGIYFNMSDTEGHPIEKLSEMLLDIIPLCTSEVLEGPFSKVVVCGWIM